MKMVDCVETSRADIDREIAMMRKLTGPCIVKIFETFPEKAIAMLWSGRCHTHGGRPDERRKRTCQAGKHESACQACAEREKCPAQSWSDVALRFLFRG